MKGKCIKQETIAIIENHGQYWVGTNWCENQVKECPRASLKSGEGYELCKSICEQHEHAEVDACIKAGENAKGGTLYLIGHSYCCNSCKNIMEQFGIAEIFIGKLPSSFIVPIKIQDSDNSIRKIGMNKQEVRKWLEGANPVRTHGSEIGNFESGYALALKHFEEALNQGTFDDVELKSLHLSTESSQ